MTRRTRLIAVLALIAMALTLPATSYSTAGGDDAAATLAAKKKKKKKCKKGYVKKTVKNKKGKKVKKCVKKKKKKAKKLSGLAPADGVYLSTAAAGGGTVTVYISGNRTKITAEAWVPAERQTCLPNNQGARGAQRAKVVNMALNAKTGEFSGTDQQGAGSGPSAIQGKFLSQKKLQISAGVSQRTNAVNDDDLCAGTAAYTVTMKKR